MTVTTGQLEHRPSTYTEQTMTLVVESHDGSPVDMDAVKEALGPHVKVRGWRGGDHLITQVAAMQMLDHAKRAALLLGINPDTGEVK